MPRASKLWAELKATVRIGKRGLCESVINEIKTQLKARKVIKVKVLKNYAESAPNFDRFKFAEELAQKVDARLLGVRGRCILLAAKKKPSTKQQKKKRRA
ncbi:MAG: RNA-binding protein [Thermoprotei archaeon]|nr:MAG: RNA-binding protein [Thermoprotei archaeon]